MDQKKVLVIGNGAREHAIIWKIKQSQLLKEVYTTSKNLSEFATYLDVNLEDFYLVARACKESGIEVVIVGQEKYLAQGITDILTSEGLGVFGPCKNAAKLESSKFFAKELCKMHDIPTAEYAYFNDKDAALQYIEKVGVPLVIKADGLASGKGVFICKSQEDAKSAIEDLMVHRKFGKAGDSIIIEEFLEGEEVSCFVLSDGKTILPFGNAHDHKQIVINEKKYNTGGMGAVCPAQIAKSTEQEVMRKIIYPIISALSVLNITYKGILFAGVMITKKGVKLLEYNTRLGDPEAQVILPRLESDFLDLVLKTINSNLNRSTAEFNNLASACLVIASKGYPLGYETGVAIHNIKEAKELVEGLHIFYAGVATDENGNVFSDGGRVLSLVATDNVLRHCIEKVYKAAKIINWQGGFYIQNLEDK